MAISREDIEQGTAAILSGGWLSQTLPEFRDALLAEVKWLVFESKSRIGALHEEGDGMYGIGIGTVGIFPQIAASDAGLIHVATAPFWFGLAPFVTASNRQVVVHARGRCVVAHVSQPSLKRLLAQQPEGWRMLMMQAAILSATTVQTISDLLIPNRDRRLAALLLRISSARTAGGVPQSVRCSQDELATMSNLSRQTVRVALDGFVKQGLVEHSYGLVRILDADRLRRLVDAG
jgi:CRP-like cAMP-binding protein